MREPTRRDGWPQEICGGRATWSVTISPYMVSDQVNRDGDFGVRAC